MADYRVYVVQYSNQRYLKQDFKHCPFMQGPELLESPQRSENAVVLPEFSSHLSLSPAHANARPFLQSSRVLLPTLCT